MPPCSTRRVRDTEERRRRFPGMSPSASHYAMILYMGSGRVSKVGGGRAGGAGGGAGAGAACFLLCFFFGGILAGRVRERGLLAAGARARDGTGACCLRRFGVGEKVGKVAAWHGMVVASCPLHTTPNKQSKDYTQPRESLQPAAGQSRAFNSCALALSFPPIPPPPPKLHFTSASYFPHMSSSASGITRPPSRSSFPARHSRPFFFPPPASLGVGVAFDWPHKSSNTLPSTAVTWSSSKLDALRRILRRRLGFSGALVVGLRGTPCSSMFFSSSVAREEAAAAATTADEEDFSMMGLFDDGGEGGTGVCRWLESSVASGDVDTSSVLGRIMWER